MAGKNDKAVWHSLVASPPGSDSGETLAACYDGRHKGTLPAFQPRKGQYNCPYPGVHRLVGINGVVRCPGCDRMCQPPRCKDLQVSDEIVVLPPDSYSRLLEGA